MQFIELLTSEITLSFRIMFPYKNNKLYEAELKNMSEITVLIKQRDELFAKIREIEENCEGVENDNNSKKISELIMRQERLLAEKSSINNMISNLENELLKTNEEIRTLSSKGIEKILKAIKAQRWYFFKNKPKVVMDRDTGMLWPSFDYYKYYKGEDRDSKFVSLEDLSSSIKVNIDGFNEWNIPTDVQFKTIIGSNFPFEAQMKNKLWAVKFNGIFKSVAYNNGDLNTYHSYCFPCNNSLATKDYELNVSLNNKIYTETERLQFTLNVFVNNGLEPKFNDDKISELYKNIFLEKPPLIKKLNGLQEQIESLQKVVLLSSTFDYDSLLAKYDIKAIDNSIIKYHEAIVSIIDDLMDKLCYFQEVKSEIIRDFNVIGLKLSKKYDENPNLTKEENIHLENRQVYFQKHFELGMNHTNAKLLAIKKQAQDIENRIELINSGDNAIKELAIIEKEERASFNLIVENVATIIKNALIKIEYFEENRNFATKAITYWDRWSEDYKVFKTTLQEDLKIVCDNDSIESEVYTAWYADWQKKRYTVEKMFLPLIECGLKGNLIVLTDDQQTVVEKTLVLLQEYKDRIDKFYIEERKNIYQKFAFEPGGDLQEKFQVESELFKFLAKLQNQIHTIIFSLEKAEDRLFLLKWINILLELHIDEILDFVKYKELSRISIEVLSEFADLKRKNFEVYISDSKAYSEELQRRENEFNSLVFKMRKDLMKQ